MTWSDSVLALRIQTIPIASERARVVSGVFQPEEYWGYTADVSQVGFFNIDIFREWCPQKQLLCVGWLVVMIHYSIAVANTCATLNLPIL
jgi:hypothetical protein